MIRMNELKIKCIYRDYTDIDYGYIYCLNPTIESKLCYLCEMNEDDLND